MDIDLIPFHRLDLATIQSTYTYGQLAMKDRRVSKLDREELIQYVEERLQLLPWIRMSIVFIQNTDAYIRSSDCSTKSWEELVSYVPLTKDIEFFSRSKMDRYRPHPQIPTDWRRVLSNFYASHVMLLGLDFPTAEHAFHGMKIIYASAETNPSEPSVDCQSPFTRATRQALIVLLSDDSPLHAKKIGGRASYRKLGLELNVEKWNTLREDIQQDIIESRLRSDAVFRRVLRWTKPSELIHYERPSLGCTPFWGAFRSRQTGEMVGHNILGKILMKFRGTLS